MAKKTKLQVKTSKKTVTSTEKTGNDNRAAKPGRVKTGVKAGHLGRV